MRVTRNDELASTLLREMSESQSEDRTGQHPSVSDLIGCLTKSFLDMHSPVEHNDQTKVFFLLGLGLEATLLAKRQKQKKSGQYQGVYYHLDNLDGGWFELKSTRINISKGGEGYLTQSGHALRQMLSYAKTQGLTELDLGIIWIIPAKFEVFRVSFEQEEVDANWEWLEIRRDVWNEAMDKGEAPKQFTWNEDWECKNCSYQFLCELRQRIDDKNKEAEIGSQL